jgi:hypothetical protein
MKHTNGKHFGPDKSWYQNRRNAAVGRFAESGYFAFVEEAQEVERLRQHRKKMHDAYPDKEEFKAHFDEEDFERAWNNFHHGAGFLTNALMKLDERPFTELAEAIKAFKDFKESGAAQPSRRDVLDVAMEVGAYPVVSLEHDEGKGYLACIKVWGTCFFYDAKAKSMLTIRRARATAMGSGRANLVARFLLRDACIREPIRKAAMLTVKEFKARAEEIWQRNERFMEQLRIENGVERKSRHRNAIDDRVLRQFLADFGILLKPDKVGRPRKQPAKKRG